MAPSAIKQSSVGTEADDCFAIRSVSELTIELATLDGQGRRGCHECAATREQTPLTEALLLLSSVTVVAVEGSVRSTGGPNPGSVLRRR